MTVKYDSRFNGAKAIAKANAQACTYPKEAGTIYYVNQNDYTYCTGYYLEVSSSDSMVYIQSTQGIYLIVDLSNPTWSFEYGSAVSEKSSAQAQGVIDTILKNNRTIIENNLVCARFTYKLTTEQKKQLYDLQTRLTERNNALLKNEYVTTETVAAPEGYNQLENYLNTFMSSGGIGSVTVAIVVAAVVVASLSTAAYYAYKYYADQSEQDVKYSNELTKILTEKLTDEEYQQLLSETKGIVTKARLKARFSSSTLWYIAGAALLAAGAALYIKRK